MNCRLCESPDLSPMPFDVPVSEGTWLRCAACGSDNNVMGYEASIYDADYVTRAVVQGDDDAKMEDHVKSNCDWFTLYADKKLGREFLDVGCADGAVLRVMQGMGWKVHGFDVTKPQYVGEHITVAPFFQRWLFPRRYAAVMCREVIEHVESPDLMLHELHGVALGGGLVQIQTPKPCDYPHPHIYQRAHLFIVSTVQLRKMIDRAMMDVIDSKEWDEIQPGQACLCRTRR